MFKLQNNTICLNMMFNYTWLGLQMLEILSVFSAQINSRQYFFYILTFCENDVLPVSLMAEIKYV